MRTGRDKRGRRGHKAELKAQAWAKARHEAKAKPQIEDALYGKGGDSRLTTRAWRLARPRVDFGLISPPIAPRLIEHEWWRKGNRNLARPFKRNGPVVTR